MIRPTTIMLTSRVNHFWPMAGARKIPVARMRRALSMRRSGSPVQTKTWWTSLL